MKPLDRIKQLEDAIKKTIMAIEAGTEFRDHRGQVYRQEFGEAFVKYLKAQLPEVDGVKFSAQEVEKIERIGGAVNSAINNGFWDKPAEERAATMDAACDRGGVTNFFDLSPEERARAYGKD